MSPYTRETLQNIPENRSLWLRQSDVEKVNRLCEAMANVRSGDPVPTDGDRIICMFLDSRVSDRGYLEYRENRLMICTQPSSIFLDEHADGQIYTRAGGGPWTGYMSQEQFLERAEYEGKTLAWFWLWGREEGSIHFEAEVFLWRFTSKTGF